MIKFSVFDYKSLHFVVIRRVTLGLLAALFLAGSVQADGIVVAGTGASQKLFREVAAAFEKTHTDCQASVPDSVGSRGGIRQLLAGQADLARVSRPLKDKELAKGLVYTEVAETQVVFAVHPSVKDVQSLTTEQVNDIYAGENIDQARPRLRENPGRRQAHVQQPRDQGTAARASLHPRRATDDHHRGSAVEDYRD
jgi:ABC-type phosphate transport system substrate-binding protein